MSLNKIMKKTLIVLMFFFITLFISHIYIHAESAKFFTISANPAENANTEMHIVWHTEKENAGSYVLYTKRSDTSWQNALRNDGTVELNKAFAGKNAKYGTTDDSLKVPYEFNKHTAVLSDLEKGTEYMYKITDGTDSSDVRYFKTGNQEFNFIWVSDFHAYYKDARRLNAATSAVNQCISLANNDVDFVLSTGDIVAYGGTYQWWKQVSEASWMKKYMFATTLGNHDWMTNIGTNYSDGASDRFMDACYFNPQNGFAGQENICYYFYYGDALFISVNTEIETAKYLNMTSDQFVKAQQDWVEEVLQNNSAQYIFLMQHYQAFATSGAFQSSGYTRWHNICDKYGVDIFFSGNSHVYMRSLPIYNGEISTDPSKGTVYMVAPSSDGERGVTYSAPTKNTDLIVSSWSDDRAKAVSLVKVTQEGISLQLVNYDGSIIDEANILPKRLPSIQEIIDLTGFDKEQFENKFKINLNQNNIANPKVLLPNASYDVLRSIKVYNQDTLQTYYEGMIQKNTTECLLNKVEKGEVNLVLELRYVDASIKELYFTIDNQYDWGYIKNPEIVEKDNEYRLIWDEQIEASRIKTINIYVDGFRYDVIDAGTCSYTLPDFDGIHTVYLLVMDKDGDMVYQSEILDYTVKTYYEVIFQDSTGKELKKELVEEGSSATAPNASEIIVPAGFIFDGWDKDFSKITKNITVTARFVEKPKEENNNSNNSGCNAFSKVASSCLSLFFAISLAFVFKRRK